MLIREFQEFLTVLTLNEGKLIYMKSSFFIKKKFDGIKKIPLPYQK
ncbi:hypothetical protein UYSO10_0182 [Kosakonia radicincitans]|nr:hypothetical protein UYSO10_0182 [Kosakonia radicincitans]